MASEEGTQSFVKCLLCRIKNQHTELLKHPNDSNVSSLQVLWSQFCSIMNLKVGIVPGDQERKNILSMIGCSVHQDESARETWFEEMIPKIKKLSTEGIKVRTRRPR